MSAFGSGPASRRLFNYVSTLRLSNEVSPRGGRDGAIARPSDDVHYEVGYRG